MLRGLGVAKEDFKLAIKDALYKGAEAACLSSFFDNANGEPAPGNATNIQTESARRFANKFAETASEPLADAIYDYIREMQITATASGTLIAPGGMSPAPCTGTLNPTDFSIV